MSVVGYGDNDDGGGNNVPSSSSFFILLSQFFTKSTVFYPKKNLIVIFFFQLTWSLYVNTYCGAQQPLGQFRLFVGARRPKPRKVMAQAQ